MTRNDKIRMVEEIQSYADEVLKDVDKEKVQISVQIEMLRPKMEEMAKKYNIDVTDVFVMYMDGISEVQAEKEREFQKKINETEDNY